VRAFTSFTAGARVERLAVSTNESYPSWLLSFPALQLQRALLLVSLQNCTQFLLKADFYPQRVNSRAIGLLAIGLDRSLTFLPLQATNHSYHAFLPAQRWPSLPHHATI